MPQKYIFSIRKLFYLNIFLGYFVFYGQTMVDDAAAAGESFCVFCDFCVTRIAACQLTTTRTTWDNKDATSVEMFCFASRVQNSCETDPEKLTILLRLVKMFFA